MRRRWARTIAVVTVALVVGMAVLFASLQQRVTAAAAEQTDTAALIKRGAVVYREQKCQQCHSVAGVGNRRSPLDDVGLRLQADVLRKWIVAPQEVNPKVRKRAFDRLPKQDVDALVMYLQTLRTRK